MKRDKPSSSSLRIINHRIQNVHTITHNKNATAACHAPPSTGTRTYSAGGDAVVALVSERATASTPHTIRHAATLSRTVGAATQRPPPTPHAAAPPVKAMAIKAQTAASGGWSADAAETSVGLLRFTHHIMRA